MNRESVWLDCTTPGCPNGTTADPRHLANLTASGGWTCPACDAADQVSLTHPERQTP